MTDLHIFRSWIAAALLWLFLFTGCASLRPEADPVLDKKALRLAQSALQLNNTVLTSRGSGIITTKIENTTQKYDIAWAAAYPDKLRATFLTAGHPVETIVSSGKSVTFISHTGRHRPHTTFSKNPDLSGYIGVPVRLSEIIIMLLGRLPIAAFDDVYQKNPSPCEIVLQKTLKGPLQHLFFDDRQNLIRIHNIKRMNRPSWDIHILSHTKTKNLTIAATMTVVDEQNRQLTLNLSDFSPNPQIKESVFRLTRKGS